MRALYEGTNEAGNQYVIRLQTVPDSNKLILQASLRKVKLGKLVLDLTLYPDIDLAPVLGVGPDGVQMIFRFGDYRTECYANDDGRNRVTIWFHKRHPPEVNVTSFVNC
jgi:hypothetical protein